MYAAEFTSTIDNGMIRVPDQYKNAIGNVVKVIVFSHEEKSLAISTEEKMKAAGALSGIISNDFDLGTMSTERFMYA